MNIMRTGRRILVSSLVAGTAVVGIATTANAGGQDVYVVQLSGDQVVGNPGGDPDGFGTATITVDHKAQQVCLNVDTTNVATPTEDYVLAAGAAGEPAGSTEVIFNVDGNNPDPSTCAVTYIGFLSFKELWRTISDDPQAFHLRVHNYEHADNGAIRGQLTPQPK